MDMPEERKRLLLFPVRRKLMGVTLFYLCGIFAAPYAVLPVEITWIFCALLLGTAALRLVRRKSALFCMLGVFALLGNALAGCELMKTDAPTGTGVWIEGTVSAIKSDYRVYLSDVTVDDGRMLLRDAVVTLMPPEGMETPVKAEPRVGQHVGGYGRLFAPDEKRNPGGVDWRIQALVMGYELSGYLLDGWDAQGEAVFSVREILRRAREALLDRVEMLFGEQAALFQGIMLGEKSDLNETFKRSMQLTGTAHILTVSGLHMTMIAYAASRLLEKNGLRRRERFVLLAAFLAVFTGITGGAAGTVRAMIMALLRELALVRGRRYEPLTALSCAALLMTLCRPVWALSASFQFSFFVVLGIVLLAGGVELLRARRRQTHSRVRSLLRRMMSAIGVSLSAQIASLPMQLLLYGYVPLLSLPMNMLCGMMMPVLMLGGWICTLIGLLFPVPGAFFARMVSFAAALFERLSVWAAGLSFSVARLPSPYPATVLCFLLLMMMLSSRIRFGGLRKMGVCALAAAVLLSYLVRFNPRARYVQLDVGQGDAALFRWGREAVVVDVGPQDSYDLLRYLRHEGLYVRAVLLSHLDEDHAGALSTLLESEIDVPMIVIADGALEEAEARKEKDAAVQGLLTAKEMGVALRQTRRGDMLSAGALDMRVLSPDNTLAGSNERSLVLHAQLEGVTFLLTGDLPSDSEPEDLPKSNVLKAAHHGSRNSTSEALLEKVKPEWAIISVGEGNWYGHPHRETLFRIEAAGAETLRTDRDGCITLWLQNGNAAAERFLEK